MSILEFENALQTHAPLVAMREAVQQCLDQGVTREQLLEVLSGVRATFRERGNTRAEDLVLDAMDFAAGWCSPHMRVG